MTRSRPSAGKVGRALAVVGWCWIGLFALAFLGLTGASLINVIARKPEGEAIVMLPMVFLVLAAGAAPGALMLLVSKTMAPRQRDDGSPS